jgi:galactonate dehydratase
MTARLSNLPPTRIEKLETFLVERWRLLRIHCEDGTVGTSKAGVHGWPRPAAAMIKEMKSYLVGRDPSTIEHHTQALQRHSHFMGALVGGAISAIDIALWDIKARRYGVSIYELMGGKTRDRVRCYMHPKGNTLDELAADAVAKQRQGFTAIRFSPFAPDYHLRKSFEEWVSEAERRVGAVHEALQGNADICIELHRQMNPAESIALGQRLQKFHPYFYEDPMLPDSHIPPKAECALSGDDGGRAGAKRAAGSDGRTLLVDLPVPGASREQRLRLCPARRLPLHGAHRQQEGGGDGRGTPRQGHSAQSPVPDLDGGLRAARRLDPQLRAAGIHGRAGSAQTRHGRAAAGVEGWLS